MPNKTILIIEDNLEIRENTEELLELAEYNVHTAENGKQGIILAKEIIPDLIICDIMMPELDGYGVLKLLSKSPTTSHIPFIFLTAKANKEDFRKGMNLGADDYLTKPFDESDLIDAIEVRLKKAENNKKVEEDSLLYSTTENNGELADFLEQKKSFKFSKNEYIYKEGDYVSFIYFLKKGSLKTYAENDDAKGYITEIISDGNYFGYSDVLKTNARTENATVLEDSEIIKIPKEYFEELLLKNKSVALEFIKMLTGNIKEKEERLIKLAFQSVRMRVRDALIMLRDKLKKEGESEFVLSISRQDLADIVGTSSESVIRTLSDFKSEGLITVEKSKIHLIDEKKLENMKY